MVRWPCNEGARSAVLQLGPPNHNLVQAGPEYAGWREHRVLAGWAILTARVQNKEKRTGPWTWRGTLIDGTKGPCADAGGRVSGWGCRQRQRGGQRGDGPRARERDNQRLRKLVGHCRYGTVRTWAPAQVAALRSGEDKNEDITNQHYQTRKR